MKSVIISCFLFAMTLQAQNKPTVAQAEEFMKKAEAELSDLGTRTNRAQWVQSNFITTTQRRSRLTRSSIRPR